MRHFVAALALWLSAQGAFAQQLNSPFVPVMSGAAASGANADITSLSALTTPLSQAQGGSGAASLGAATVPPNFATNSATAQTLSYMASLNAVEASEYGCAAAINNAAVDAGPCISTALSVAASAQRRVHLAGGVYYVQSPISWPSRGGYLVGDNWNMANTNGTTIHVVSSAFMSGGANAAAFTASISGTTLTVSAVSAGKIVAGMVLSGTGIPSNAYVQSQTSGAAGGAGVYVVNLSLTVASETIAGVTPPISIIGAYKPSIDGIEFTEDQPADAAGWTPNAYGPMIFVSGARMARFTNLYAASVNDFIQLNSTGGAWFDTLQGQVHGYLVDIESNTDYMHVDHVHMNDWACGVTACPNVAAYDDANAVAFLSRRNDNPTFHDVNVYGVFTPFEFDYQSGGLSTGPTVEAQISDSQCDRCTYGLYVTANGTNTTAQISNFIAHHMNIAATASLSGSSSIYVAASGAVINIDNLRSELAGDSAISLANATSTTLNVSNFVAYMWGSVAVNSAACSTIYAVNPGVVAGSTPNLVTGSQWTFTPSCSSLTYGTLGNNAGGLGGAPAQGWTPTLQFGGATTGVTYSADAGTCYRSFNVTTCQFSFTLTSVGTATSIAQIKTLPFAANGSGSWGFSGGGACAYSSGMSSLTSPVQVQVPGGATYLNLYETGATGSTQLTNANFSASTVLRCNFSYLN